MSRLNRLSSKALAAVGAGAFAVALTVGGAGSAVAAPTSGSFDSMQDFKGGWLTSLTGFQDGDAISWQHRMIVRKVMGSAAVAWEQWRDCAGYAAACTAGKATGVGWTSPSRVLLVMDPKGGVHGVGATGTLELTPGETGTTGMTAVMIGAGQRPNPTVSPAPASTSQTRNVPVSPCHSPAGCGTYAVQGVPTQQKDGGSKTIT